MTLPQRSWGRKAIPKQEVYVCSCGKKTRTFKGFLSHQVGQWFSDQEHYFSHWTKHGIQRPITPEMLKMVSNYPKDI